MAIVATFPTGVDEITVTGLHQWDYGQSLEIHASDLGTMVAEVHFACPKMGEAVVRSCSFTLGVGTAAIPDACLEQMKPIVAWVYEIGETSGETVKTIILPVIARTRPEPTQTVPQSTSDRYTEAIAEMNAAVDAIEAGNVTAGMIDLNTGYIPLVGGAPIYLSNIFESTGAAKKATGLSGVKYTTDSDGTSITTSDLGLYAIFTTYGNVFFYYLNSAQTAPYGSGTSITTPNGTGDPDGVTIDQYYFSSYESGKLVVKRRNITGGGTLTKMSLQFAIRITGSLEA